MLIKDNVPHLHEEIAKHLNEDSDFSNYLQCFNVVNGRKHIISRVMFVKGGLKRFLDDCRDPKSNIFISGRAEASACCTRLSLFLCERMASFNLLREAKGLNPVPYGSKIWVLRSLGIYFTIGCQDLERFFEEGKRLAQQRLEEEIDGGDHRYGEPS